MKPRVHFFTGIRSMCSFFFIIIIIILTLTLSVCDVVVRANETTNTELPTSRLILNIAYTTDRPTDESLCVCVNRMSKRARQRQNQLKVNQIGQRDTQQILLNARHFEYELKRARFKSTHLTPKNTQHLKIYIHRAHIDRAGPCMSRRLLRRFSAKNECSPIMLLNSMIQCMVLQRLNGILTAHTCMFAIRLALFTYSYYCRCICV